MPELPKIPVPTVKEIDRYTQASIIKVLLGCVAILMVSFITFVVKYGSGNDCNDRYDKLNERFITELQKKGNSAVEIDSLKNENKILKQVVEQLTPIIKESTTLSKQAVKKTR